MQDFGNGLQPVAYDSMKLDAPAQNYATRDREMLAVIRALKVWNHYLDGHTHVHVYTDHATLQYFLTQDSAKFNKRQVRWMEEVQSYMPNLSLHYRPGRENVVADALSRKTVISADPPMTDPLGREVTPAPPAIVVACTPVRRSEPAPEGGW